MSDLLQIRNLVDGRPFVPRWDLSHNAPLEGRTYELLYTACGPWVRETPEIGLLVAAGLWIRQGEHRVRAEAQLPGSTLTLHTRERMLALHCEGEPRVGAAVDECLKPPLDPRAPSPQPVQDLQPGDESEDEPSTAAREEAASAQCRVASPGVAGSWPLLAALWSCCGLTLAWRRRFSRARRSGCGDAAGTP